MSTPDFYITSRKEAARALCHHEVGRSIRNVVSIGEAGSMPPPGFRAPGRARIRLEFDDVEHAKLPSGYRGCTDEDVRSIIQFGRKVAKNQKPTLVHCAAGISRSSATALVLIAMLLGEGNETEAVARLAQAVRKTSDVGLRDDNYIRPNRRIVWMADRELGRDGALFTALTDAYTEIYGSTRFTP